MTSLVNDNGEYLQYEGKDPQLSKQAMSLFEFKIKGSYSTNFSLPNNSHNRSVLGYFGPLQIDSPAFSRNRFTLVRNGIRVDRGYLVIQTVSEESIDCFFISGNGSWFNALNIDMKGLDYDDYNLTWNAANFDAQKSATSGIVFPIVDWGYNGYKLGKNIHLDLQVQNGSDFIIGESNERISEGYPCFFFHSALNVLANDSGINIDGDLLSDPVFKGMIMTPEGPDLKWPDLFIEPNKAFVKRSANQSYLLASGEQTLQFDQVIEQGDTNPYDASTYSFYCRKTATYKVTIDLNFSAAQVYLIRLRINGTNYTTVFNSINQADFFTEFFINGNAGDYMDLRVTPFTSNYTLFATSTIKYEIYDVIDSLTLIYDGTGSSVIVNRTIITPSAIIPSIKGIDFIKFLASYFNCIVTYNESTNTLNLNKFDGITDQEDWSEYYISHKSNYNRKLGKNNYIELSEGQEEGIVRYNKGSIIGYGWGNIETDYDSLDQTILYKAPFAPAYDQKNKTKLGWGMPYIKFFEFEDDEYFAFTGVTDTSGEATLGFASSVYTNLPTVVRIVSEKSDYDGYAYPRYNGSSASSVILNGVDFTVNTPGGIYTQKVTRVSGKSRILFTIPSYNQQGVGGPASVEVDQFIEASTATLSTTQTAFFCKPKYGQPIDSFVVSLAIKDPMGREFNASISDIYHSKLKKAFNSPVIECMMLLPEAKYESYNFNKFVYIKSKELTGLFFVHKIDPYVDGKTLTKVELIFV